MTTWNLSGVKQHVLICNGGSCMKNGGEEVTQMVRSEITRLGLDNKVHTTRTRCNGRCDDAPVVIVYPEGTWYQKVSPEMAKDIVTKHLSRGEVVDSSVSYTYSDEGFVPSSMAPEGIRKK